MPIRTIAYGVPAIAPRLIATTRQLTAWPINFCMSSSSLRDAAVRWTVRLERGAGDVVTSAEGHAADCGQFPPTAFNEHN